MGRTDIWAAAQDKIMAACTQPPGTRAQAPEAAPIDRSELSDAELNTVAAGTDKTLSSSQPDPADPDIRCGEHRQSNGDARCCQGSRPLTSPTSVGWTKSGCRPTSRSGWCTLSYQAVARRSSAGDPGMGSGQGSVRHLGAQPRAAFTVDRPGGVGHHANAEVYTRSISCIQLSCCAARMVNKY
jgi:hypothetical protein